MFGMKAKPENKALALEALGYEVNSYVFEDGVTVLHAAKDNHRHTAHYKKGKLILLNSSKLHQWHDVVSYQPTPTAPFMKDFK